MFLDQADEVDEVEVAVPNRIDCLRHTPLYKKMTLKCKINLIKHGWDLERKKKCQVGL